MSDFIWGVAAIAKVIGRTPKQTYRMLYDKRLTSPRKFGDLWMVSRQALYSELGADAKSVDRYQRGPIIGGK